MIKSFFITTLSVMISMFVFNSRASSQEATSGELLKSIVDGEPFKIVLEKHDENRDEGKYDTYDERNRNRDEGKYDTYGERNKENYEKRDDNPFKIVIGRDDPKRNEETYEYKDRDERSYDKDKDYDCRHDNGKHKGWYKDKHKKHKNHEKGRYEDEDDD